MATNKFFTIEFKGGLDLINQLSQVELELKRVNDAIKEAKKTGDTEVYKKLRIEQEELKKSSQELKKNLRDSIKDFEGQKASWITCCIKARIHQTNKGDPIIFQRTKRKCRRVI